MACPNLTVTDVQSLVPAARNIRPIGEGGQKQVFLAEIDGIQYALKFLKCNVQQVDPDILAEAEVSVVDNVTARAVREVETLRQCNTPYLVKPGRIGLTPAEINHDKLLYFTEEYIDGEPLNALLKRRQAMTVTELVRLGRQMTAAIAELWRFSKIHRDIKPGNIMCRRGSGDFVLLDMGLVFDLDDRSFSVGTVGTHAYYSPEQMDFRHRRSVLDFRSDTFSLGIVLYLMATLRHPFATNAQDSGEVWHNIQNLAPPSPKSISADMPDELNDIIMRLLAKRPALRYRKVQMLLDALNAVPV